MFLGRKQIVSVNERDLCVQLSREWKAITWVHDWMIGVRLNKSVYISLVHWIIRRSSQLMTGTSKAGSTYMGEYVLM